jgi:ABC-2 type transport system permease protein
MARWNPALYGGGLMKSAQLFQLFWKFGILNEAEYRFNFLLHLFETLIKFGSGISVLWVVFTRTTTIGGWNWDELLVLLGWWFILSGLVNMVLAPSMKQFMNDVWKGNLDYLLTKPVNHQFMASTRKVVVFQIVDMLVGIVVMTIGLVRLRHGFSTQQVLMFAITMIAGSAILYAFWITLATLSLWVVKLENIVVIFFAMFEAGRWPSTLYPFWLKYSLVFLVPIGVAITIPSEALLGRLHWSTLGMAVAWAVLAFYLSRRFFRYGVTRKYMGASA